MVYSMVFYSTICYSTWRQAGVLSCPGFSEGNMGKMERKLETTTYWDTGR